MINTLNIFGQPLFCVIETLDNFAHKMPNFGGILRIMKEIANSKIPNGSNSHNHNNKKRPENYIEQAELTVKITVVIVHINVLLRTSS